MRRIVTILLSAVLVLGGVLFQAGPAAAATGVTIKTISTKTASYAGKVTVKPRVTKSASVKITSKKLKVKSGSSTIAKSSNSVKLRAGSYKITTTVKYKVKKKGKYGKTKIQKRTQSLRVRQGAKNCATYADFQKLNVNFDYPEYYGDSMALVAQKLFNNGTRDSFSNSDGNIIEFRDYRACISNASIYVGFYNGYAYTSDYSNY